MLTKTKSRMKEHYNCFYNFNDENLFINSSETKGIYPNIIEKTICTDMIIDIIKRYIKLDLRWKLKL